MASFTSNSRAAAGWILAWVTAFAIWELVLRACVESPIPFHHDPSLGWLPTPRAAGLYTQEGWSFTRYNEQGFRDRPLTARKPGEFRILCLGDSFTEGQQMSAALTYPSRLEEMLKAQAAARAAGSVRVFNGGRSHSTPAAAIALAPSYLTLFDPDWVVLLVRDGSFFEALSSEYEEYLTVSDGDVHEVARFRRDREGSAKRALLDLGARKFAFMHWGFVRGVQLLATPARPAKHVVARPRPRSSWVPALRYTLLQLKQRYPHVLVTFLPSQSLPLDPAITRPSAEETELLAAGRELDVAVFSLRSRAQARFAQDHRPLYGFFNTSPGLGHPNENAHELIAEALADYFRQHVLAARLSSEK